MTIPDPIQWLRDLEAAATQGPWDRDLPDEQDIYRYVLSPDGLPVARLNLPAGRAEGDARLIAAARNLMPVLLDVLDLVTVEQGCSANPSTRHADCAGCRALAAIRAEMERQA